MKYIEFDNSKEFDLILLGRVAVDLNPVDYYCPLNESTTFKRYLGGSPANIAVGLARLGSGGTTDRQQTAHSVTAHVSLELIVARIVNHIAVGRLRGAQVMHHRLGIGVDAAQWVSVGAVDISVIYIAHARREVAQQIGRLLDVLVRYRTRP